MGFLRHPAAAMRPPFPNWALKVTYAHHSGKQWKPAEPCQNLTFLNLSYAKYVILSLKIQLFKNAPFKFKIQATMVYMHKILAS